VFDRVLAAACFGVRFEFLERNAVEGAQRFENNRFTVLSLVRLKVEFESIAGIELS
jgi:hypothetical protein